MKRQRVEHTPFVPTQYIQINGGVNALSWINGENLVAGCATDHAIKIIDIEKSYLIKQSINTDYKVPTCLDTAQDHLILQGSEDSVIRLWDTRAGDQKSAKLINHKFKGHSKWVSQVKFNPQVENIFLSGSLDGTVRLWDLRNDETPLANLKHKSQQKQSGENNEDFKIFALEWNGASQILSGGSDSHISVNIM